MTMDASAKVLERYNAKVFKNRKEHMLRINPEEAQQITANTRAIPGIMTNRGCCYAGCKGVVLGPIKDMVLITHGPVGCGFYSWGTRRNKARAEEGEPNFIQYCFTTDLQEPDIVFGGTKKLKTAIDEIMQLMSPKTIMIAATCPVGLIGDDVHAVAREMKAKLGISIFGFSCEGYKGVSQSAGHHIANNKIFTEVVGTSDTPVRSGKFTINMLGEYNIGGDAFEIERILEKCGITLNATFSGNSTYNDFAAAQLADLSCVMCHRSINYVADMLETKYGIPWIKVNFIGAHATAKSLRRIANHFGDEALIKRVEEVIAEEMPEVEAALAEIKPRTTGKTAMLFVGGSRAHHYQELFTELGMTTLAAGYEFAHRDDYEGRHVIPTIKVDADSRNIEELEIEADPEKYKARLTEDEIKAREASGWKFKEYEGLIADMPKKTLIIDDLNQFEADRLIEMYKPDIFCAGIKEKYSVQKMGVPLKQLHSYDYGGPYAGFKGAINYYKDIDRMVNSKVWSKVKAPWHANDPELTACFVAG